MLRDIKDFLDKRKLIMTLAQSDFRKKFVGSYFGAFWMFVQPIVTVAIYYFVFQVAMGAKPSTDKPYVIWLIPGIIPWFFFNEAVAVGTNSLYEYQHLVKKMVFKVSILPIVKLLSSFFLHLIFIWIMLIVYFLFGEHPSIWWVQMFYYMFCNVVLIFGFTMLTSAVNVLFKDMGQLVNILLQFGFWLAPVMWELPQIPEQFHFLIKLNPFYYIVQGYRDSFVFHKGFWEYPELTIYYWVVTGVILILGCYVFKKLKPHFADVL